MSRFSVFSHLSSPKVEEYRAVLDVFARARTEFVIHLRPHEIARRIGTSEEALEPTLAQLSEWQNLDRHRDHIDATSIEDFNRTRYLFQLSPRGEAAERALKTFEESLQQPGELQTEALRDIIRYLEALAKLLSDPTERDISKLLAQFRELNSRFEEFTVQAQRFMQFLQSTIELHGLSEDDFIDYKERLIDYLQRFVNELITSASEIEQKTTLLVRAGIDEVFEAVARQARADALDPSDLEKLAAETARFAGRWQGLRRWFVGGPHGQSQAETLRARAREAIPSLLGALANFHDRRETGSDRQRDWRELAHWFAETRDDNEAHRLWRVAFAMGPARHLRINQETLDFREQADDSARTSWLDAEPMWLEPRLRKTGRANRSGRAPDIVDFSKEREALRRANEQENAQILKAHATLTREEKTRLADFSQLDPVAFRLLLDLLGRAVTAAGNRPTDAAEKFPVSATSADGSLLIDLWPPPSPNDPDATALATICTTAGELTGPNYQIVIRPAHSSTASDFAAAS